VPVNSTHPDYDAHLPAWLRARDVLAGEDAVKAGAEKYLPRLDSQSSDEFAAYLGRASFFNATGRTAEAYLGLVFRRPPFIKLPSGSSTLNPLSAVASGRSSPGAGGLAKADQRSTALGLALQAFVDDADMLGTSLTGYARNVLNDVLAVGRAGSLIDWEDTHEHRAFASLYRAEQ